MNSLLSHTSLVRRGGCPRVRGNASFPPAFLKSGARVQEQPGPVMDDAAEAAAYRGTAGRMWRWILRPFARRVLDRVPFGGRVLDLGTGPGLMPIYWARQRPDVEAVGVDLSPAMLDLARAEAGRAGVGSRVRFILADAAATGLPSGSFDVVTCHYMLHHFADPAPVLREMRRLAGPDGAVLARDLVRPAPLLARLSVLFARVFLRNGTLQNQQYADSLAAGFTPRELRRALDRAGLTGLSVRGGPVHVVVSQKGLPRKAKASVFTHERAGQLLAGTVVMATVALAWLVSPWFLLATAGTALNQVLSGITGRCVVKSLLMGLGMPGERDLGRVEGARMPLERPLAGPPGGCRGWPVNRIGIRANLGGSRHDSL